MNVFQLGHPTDKTPTLVVHLPKGAAGATTLFEKFEEGEDEESATLMDHKAFSWNGSVGDIALREGEELVIGDAPHAVRLSLTRTQVRALGEGSHYLDLAVEGVYSYPFHLLSKRSYLHIE